MNKNQKTITPLRSLRYYVTSSSFCIFLPISHLTKNKTLTLTTSPSFFSLHSSSFILLSSIKNNVCSSILALCMAGLFCLSWNNYWCNRRLRFSLSNHSIFFPTWFSVLHLQLFPTFSVLPLLQTRQHGQYEEERNDESLHSQWKVIILIETYFKIWTGFISYWNFQVINPVHSWVLIWKGFA